MQESLSLLVIFICLGLVVSKVQTGIVITLGLTVLAAGCIGTLDPWAWSDRALRLMFWGIGLVSLGIIWRYGVRPVWLRLSMRWDAAHQLAHLLGFEQRAHRATGGRRRP